MKKFHILLVDDDPLILEGIGSALELNGYQVLRASNGEMALDRLGEKVFDLVITELVMETGDGLQVLKSAKKLNPNLPVIILTGYGDLNSAIMALRHRADDYLLKPCEFQELMFRVKSCIGKQGLNRKFKLYQKLLPMCCVCKKARNDAGKKSGTGDWVEIETYIHKITDLEVTSGYCPECAQKLMAELARQAR